MRFRLTLLFLVVTICSCSESKQTNSTSLKSQDPTTNRLEQGTISNEESPSVTATDCSFSDEFKEIIKLLQQDDYNIDSTLTEDSLKFEIRNPLEVVKSYTFLPKDYKFVFAKRNTRLKGMEDNWYPNFRVYEICFDNAQIAIEYEKKLTEVLSSPDLFNDKNYDYLVRHHDRIIYVTCGAKIFEKYAFQYRDTIEEIMKN